MRTERRKPRRVSASTKVDSDGLPNQDPKMVGEHLREKRRPTMRRSRRRMENYDERVVCVGLVCVGLVFGP